MFYVYRITGPTGEYIGKTSNVASRWTIHKKVARYGNPAHLYRALRLHGPEAFAVETIASARTEEDALACEVQAISCAKAQGIRLYNMTDGGEGLSGYKASAETRAIWVKQRTGRKMPREAVEKTAAAHRGMKRSEETCAKISAARLGKKNSKPYSAETLAKKSENMKGNKNFQGRKHSPETLAKMRAAALLREERKRLAQLA